MDATLKNPAGWRGGIGLTFGNPAVTIPNVSELGYEISWGEDSAPHMDALDVAMYVYFNSIVEISLKNEEMGYDFSKMDDKEHAAKAAFDAWAEHKYKKKGLSAYATVTYKPDGSYGDVYGTMDFEQKNPLTQAVIDAHLEMFTSRNLKKGGIALDNAGRITKTLLESMKKRFAQKGYSIASNGAPQALLKYIDFLGNEGFPYSPQYARSLRAAGYRGILAEFTMRHLAPGELESYILHKHLSGIVFFGYTNGGIAATAMHAFYSKRPDVYHHHRFVFHRWLPLSRAMQRARYNACNPARFSDRDDEENSTCVNGEDVSTTGADGKVVEKKHDWKEAMDFRSIPKEGFIERYGDDHRSFLYIGVNGEKTVEVPWMKSTMIAYDEREHRIVNANKREHRVRFEVQDGMHVMHIGTAQSIVTDFVDRMQLVLTEQLRQRKTDRTLGLAYAVKPWAPFAQGYALDEQTRCSKPGSMVVEGGKFYQYQKKFSYYRRGGAAQHVLVDQKSAQHLTLGFAVKADQVKAADPFSIDSLACRMEHMNMRQARLFCAHLYLDDESGEWPTVHTYHCSPGTYDWKNVSFTVHPKKPVATATVLLEYFQDQGKVWFDNIVLTCGNDPRNLLSASDFSVEESNEKKQWEALVDKKVNAWIDTLERAKTKPIGIDDVQGWKATADELERLLADRSFDADVAREVKDVRNIRSMIHQCVYILESCKRRTI